MDKIISASVPPITAVFSQKNGTPIYINSAIGKGYTLRDDGVIIDLATGAGVGVGLQNQMLFPATLVRLGALSKPDFDYTNNGLLFPQNDTSEVAYMIGQLPYRAANLPSSTDTTTTLKPHVHFVQTSSGVPVFKLKYKLYNNGDAVPAAFTTITTTGLTFTYVSGSLMQVANFPEILNTGQKVSSIIDMQLYRDDNVVASDVLVKEFDIHFLSFSFGTVP